jgi:hypothetical protein
MGYRPMYGIASHSTTLEFTMFTALNTFIKSLFNAATKYAIAIEHTGGAAIHLAETAEMVAAQYNQQAKATLAVEKKKQDKALLKLEATV